MLKCGDSAPEFSLPDHDNKLCTLTMLLRNGPLVLYFYPADFTSLCSREACTFRDRHDELQAGGLTLAGISPQSPASHRRFREQHTLPFPLLSDTRKRVIREYGADGPARIGVRRVTYLIDSRGRIVARVRADVRLARHERFLDRALAFAAQSQAAPSP